MEESSSSAQNDVEEQWNDAPDEFPFPDSGAGDGDDTPAPPRKALRRRRSTPHGKAPILGNYSKFRENIIKIENERVIENNLESVNVKDDSLGVLEGGDEEKEKEKEEVSAITNENVEEIGDSVGDGDRFEENDSGSSSSVLLFCVDMLIKSIVFQFRLLVSVVTFPVWLIYTSYMFVVDPLGIMRRGRSYVVGRVMGMVGIHSGNLWPFICKWLREHDSLWNLGMKFGWGILWSGYVSVVLIGLLLLAFGMGRLIVKGVVEEPLRIKEVLNFDYTEKSPVAYVQLEVHPMGDRLLEYKENVEELKKIDSERLLRPNQKLQVTVSLKLPESDYNRNLGNFQVKVDLLTADGKTLASSRRPCIMRFKSDIIRYILTFINVAPLITGYASEAQTMNINFRGFTEGSRPTACLRVIIEQRAEFQPNGGIPEIYSASLALESELPLPKRVMWYWKKTLFVWISMTLFTMELFFALLCCRPLVIPRIKLRVNSSSRNSPSVNPHVQR